MKTLKLTFIILLLSVCGYSQTNKTLVADETELIMLKSSFKIETSNEKVFKLIYDTFKSEGFKYTSTLRKDRTGLYLAYTVPFKMDELDRVKEFIKKLNK